jgi:hypothetical protein
MGPVTRAAGDMIELVQMNFSSPPSRGYGVRPKVIAQPHSRC